MRAGVMTIGGGDANSPVMARLHHNVWAGTAIAVCAGIARGQAGGLNCFRLNHIWRHFRISVAAAGSSVLLT